MQFRLDAVEVEALKEAERVRLVELYAIEHAAYGEGFLAVAGVDEVGRGALAGPVSAGACILPRGPLVEFLNDSKKLTAARRSSVARAIRQIAISWSVAHVDPAEVDRVGISEALRTAMRAAVSGLSTSPDLVLLDGRPIGLGLAERAVVKGDATIAAIAAASVLAKVERDGLMVELDATYPGYGLASNKGYGSAGHIEAIRQLGLSPVHRRTFCGNFLPKS